MKNLLEALSEIKAEIANGSVLNDDLIKSVAEDFELNPALLKRKVEENNIRVENVIAFVENTSEEARKKQILEKARETVKVQRQRYRVATEKEIRMKWNDIEFLLICVNPRDSKRPYLGVDLTDGKIYNFPHTAKEI